MPKWVKDPDFTTVAIIPCTAQKSEVGAPAREVWVGGHFQLTLAYAEYFFDKVYIMSYKYGFITPDFYIEPYDIDMRLEKAAERIRWWYMMKDQIADLVERDKPSLVALFTGQFERSRIMLEFLRNDCPNVIVPWEGLGSGYRQQVVYDGTPPFDYESLKRGEYALPADFKVTNPQAEYKKNRIKAKGAEEQPAVEWED